MPPDAAPRTVAHLRVSTVDQDTEKNRAAILALANHKRLGHVEFVEERVSATVSWRSRRIGATFRFIDQTIGLHPAWQHRIGATIILVERGDRRHPDRRSLPPITTPQGTGL